jgi:hypothetical protein
MRRHRDSSTGWSSRLQDSLRAFNGEYHPDVLQDIAEFGGSKVYARIIAVKCRAAAAMLRDIYLSGGLRPWGIGATPDPTIPDDKRADIDALIVAESGAAQATAQTGVLNPETGQPLTPPSEEEVAARRMTLEYATQQAALKRAREEAKEAENYVDDLLVEGGFYSAMAEFLMDLPMFPFACIHGPVVYMTPSIKWEKGQDGKMKCVKKKSWPAW